MLSGVQHYGDGKLKESWLSTVACRCDCDGNRQPETSKWFGSGGGSKALDRGVK